MRIGLYEKTRIFRHVSSIYKENRLNYHIYFTCELLKGSPFKQNQTWYFISTPSLTLRVWNMEKSSEILFCLRLKEKTMLLNFNNKQLSATKLFA